MSNKDQIIKAWELLNHLEGSIKCNCTIEQDEITDIRCLYYKYKAFIKAVDNNPKY